ncbi:hypothetical protein CkaCkLH20_00383 [Colletotrichum karsti]|uniref:CCHC-type domain-containing protein n=1 Tax=Colletotrichum karsti TaxID=1095194 RepID=A0A9P6LRB6_9PEZI|nr:uncharacterized protein CkaCkLH20_00383 [Colletotrichum karsti]KAF9882347.1 hypothetical protein CkaCkLH20_00383 [Colletotrichum karsti]
MEASETEAAAVPGDVQEPVEVVETSQPSKKRSLEDMQQNAEPDASEPHQAPSPEPEAKRAKTGQTDKKEALDEDGDEKSAEEGELEEDDEDAQASNSVSEEMGGGQSGDGQKLAADAGSKRMTRSMAAAANDSAHVGWNHGITSQIRTSLGGAAKAKASPAPTKTKSKEPTPEPEPEVEAEVEVEPTPHAATESAPSQVAQPTAPATKEPAKKAPLTRAERRQEKQAQAAADSKKSQEELKKPFEYAPGLSFYLPSKKNLLSPKGNNIGSGVWKSKFHSWCQSFVSRNIDQKDQLNADIAVAALLEYIATRAHWSKKRQRGAATGEARKPQTRNDMAVNLATILKNDDYLAKSAGTGTEDSPMVIEDDDSDDDDVQEISPPSGTTTPGNAAQTAASNAAHSDQREEAVLPLVEVKEDSEDISDDGMESGRPGPVVLGEEDDLAQQRKYFPGLAESECICVYCATPGHTSSACPRTACKFCEGEDHFSWNCPTRERCTKCRQLGHGKGQCTEKLISLDEEGAECATCGSQAHDDDDDCEVLWRSYKPQSGMIKKVNFLPAFCGACGAEGHYYSDCAFRGDKPRSQTWSLRNRDRYLDKNAADGPISDFASIPKPPQLQIKGASASRNHIFYADSDGSEEGEFLGQKVKPRAPPGKIQMASNIQLGNFGVQQQQQQQQQQPQPQQNGRGQQRGGWSAQPPLPPGPPPPGPPVGGSYSRMAKSHNNQSRPPPPNNGAGRGGLPPKPPAPQHGYHTVAPPPNGPGPNAKKPRTRQPANAPSGPSHHQNGRGGAGGRRRGKNRRGGKQG